MKGLLIKDFCLLKNMMQTIILINILAVFLSSTNNNPFFIVAYVTFFFTYLSIGTMSYDDIDNGISYLMTLPVTSTTYVLSKYILGLLMSFTGLLIGNAVIFLISFANKYMVLDPEGWAVTFVYLFLAMILLSILLPVQFKFGASKPRIALFVIYGIFLAVISLVSYAKTHLGLLPEGITIPQWSTAVWLGLAAVTAIIVFVISYRISVWIMQKRQY